VHYFWRADDFPQQHFGDSRAYGLIAQDVEAVLPELVVTNADGFKAVDYSKLSLLTIQAVKELKAENEELKAGNEELKQRVAQNDALRERVDELERVVAAMLANAAAR
jgi:Tfp pilus assembly protein PilO